jgi:RNA polymerase sigma-70 factor (ECF subfamily)
MPQTELTCWTLIREAGAGDAVARERFARLYEPVVRAYLAARWRGHRLAASADDAAQDVFVELFRPGGALDRVDPEHAGGFRPFLFGVVRNVALRHEAAKRPFGPPGDLDRLSADDTSVAAAFDKAWARSLLKEAARVQHDDAQKQGERAVRRYELLELRFQKGLPIREIAKLWDEDATKLHHEYATARDEFRAVLRTVVAFHHPSADPGEIEQACRELLGLLR